MTSFATLRQLASERPLVALAGAILACEVVGASGALFTAQGLASWYDTLVKPALAPPNWVFGPVWTALFALLGVAVWLVWRRGIADEDAPLGLALGIFAVHFVFNVAWSAVFFGAQSIAGGLAVIAVLWVLIVATAWGFARVDRRAAALLAPYLAWVTFAAYLNYRFLLLN